ncbi:hypothetical protein IscW_ISCW012304 [Ixodes scapularis]|uniref:Secreted protein n=1 Tax=Ixodes scapularis TaxID=6945 RepID=B7QFR4_IXOSC|nr:hypothetical protein IscW_ISCW012304 [Ixodes scapularis]|eukprot:XP_002414378.1 hypothetical protein IscW_ISCW012304 [Ixodes scapularis]
MFITAAVFTVTGAVVAVRSAFGSEPEDSWALPLEEDLQASRKRIYCFFNSSAHRRPEPMTFSVAHINVDYCDDIVYTYLGVDSMAANIVSKVGATRLARNREKLTYACRDRGQTMPYSPGMQWLRLASTSIHTHCR